MILNRFDLAILAVAVATLVSNLLFVTLMAILAPTRRSPAGVSGSISFARTFVAGFKQGIGNWTAYFAPALWLFGAAGKAARTIRDLCRTRAGRWQLGYVVWMICQSVTVFVIVLNS